MTGTDRPAGDSGGHRFNVAETAAGPKPVKFPVDLGWHNFAYALRAGAAAIAALGIAYWLQLSDPQWAGLTAYLIAQPTVGAAMSKGVWRAIGTVSGGVLGLVIVALFSQAAELMVGVTMLTVGVNFYVAARLRNYATYGFVIAGFTTLLVAYEGSANPVEAWSIAADRVVEILLGVACVTATSAIIFPRYAGTALRDALAATFSGLTQYAAAAFRLQTTPAEFVAMRSRMVAQVVSFDALRSYALFEAPEMRANAGALRRTLEEFLVVLAIARGLFFRFDDFRGDGAQAVLAKVRPALEETATEIERAASDPAALRDLPAVRRQLLSARIRLNALRDELEQMVGAAPFDALSNGLLIVRRTGDLVHGLSMVVVAEAVSLRRGTPSARRIPRPDPAFEARFEAVLIGLRAVIALSLLTILWMATGWSMGFGAVVGGVVMLLITVNKDEPLAVAGPFMVWTGAGVLLACVLIAFVLPYLQGFPMLAAVLLLALLPAGLMASTPRLSSSGVAFGVFMISEVGTGNSFAPDMLTLVNGAVALLIGMGCCTAVLAAIPVSSRQRRSKSWAHAIGELLPAVARGTITQRHASGEIVKALAALLPRLTLARQSDEDFFRGTLGAASMAHELGRLRQARADPQIPREAGEAIDLFLDRFAAALERLVLGSSGRDEGLTDAEGVVARLHATLSSLALEPGSVSARAVLRAGASVRFIADRFRIDRAYLDQSFAGR